MDDEVQRPEVGQRVAVDSKVGCLGQQLAQALDGERVRQPFVGRIGARPDAEVGVAALVTGPCADDQAQGHIAGRPWRRSCVWVTASVCTRAGYVTRSRRRRDVDAPTVGEDHDMVDDRRGDERRPVDAEG